MNNTEKCQTINQIFSLWNPIGVPDYIARTEYTDYVMKTFSYKNDFIGLVKYLENILTEHIEFEYDKDNIEEKKDVLYYAYLIYKELQN